MNELLKYDFTIQALAQHYFPNPADREDAIQEAYIKLMESTPSDDVEQKDGWVWRVVSNLYTDLYNKNKRLRELDRYAAIEEDVEESCPFTYTERLSEETELNRRIDDLPPDLHAVAVNYYFRGMSYAQLAEEFDIPIGTVASRLNTVRKFLAGDD